MPWTRQMEQDLASIDAEPEWPGDTALVIHVRLQRLVQNAKQVHDEHSTPPHIPFFLRYFRSQLEDIKKSLPADFHSDSEFRPCPCSVRLCSPISQVRS